MDPTTNIKHMCQHSEGEHDWVLNRERGAREAGRLAFLNGESIEEATNYKDILFKQEWLQGYTWAKEEHNATVKKIDLF